MDFRFRSKKYSMSIKAIITTDIHAIRKIICLLDDTVLSEDTVVVLSSISCGTGGLR